MQKGADPWQAAGNLGMSLEVLLLNTYGHHHPVYLSDARSRALRFDEVVSGAKLVRMPGWPFGRCAIASRRQAAKLSRAIRNVGG
jgi:hypothetical protein